MSASYYPIPTGVVYASTPVVEAPTVIFAQAQQPQGANYAPTPMDARSRRLIIVDIFFLFTHVALAVLPAATFRLPESDGVLILRIFLTICIGPVLRCVSWVIIAISKRSERHSPYGSPQKQEISGSFSLI